MATFFENFKDAERIILPTRTNPYGEANLPSMNRGSNSAAWEKRVAVPFSYNERMNDGKKVLRSGILYMPAYEASKIKNTGKNAGSVAPDYRDVEIYGAEVQNQSLNKEGFQKLFDNEDNSDFKFDIESAQQAFKGTNGRNSTSTDVSGYEASNGNFIKNLRSVLWGL
jgi:hypothetical protein